MTIISANDVERVVEYAATTDVVPGKQFMDVPEAGSGTDCNWSNINETSC